MQEFVMSPSVQSAGVRHLTRPATSEASFRRSAMISQTRFQNTIAYNCFAVSSLLGSHDHRDERSFPARDRSTGQQRHAVFGRLSVQPHDAQGDCRRNLRVSLSSRKMQRYERVSWCSFLSCSNSSLAMAVNRFPRHVPHLQGRVGESGGSTNSGTAVRTTGRHAIGGPLWLLGRTRTWNGPRTKLTTCAVMKSCCVWLSTGTR